MTLECLFLLASQVPLVLGVIRPWSGDWVRVIHPRVCDQTLAITRCRHTALLLQGRTVQSTGAAQRHLPGGDGTGASACDANGTRSRGSWYSSSRQPHEPPAYSTAREYFFILSVVSCYCSITRLNSIQFIKSSHLMLPNVSVAVL